MENFVLYEEVGRGDHSVVYKGRRKGTINFVAIHCIDKCKRPEITNLVRLTHEIQHENVVNFYEWYETSNHLWLVVELCTGGSLETVITQDDHLPESSVRKFGTDMVTGLHHIHSLGLIFSDIKPSKILLDGPGVLKFSDFGLSRVEGEKLDELFEQFADVAEIWKTEQEDSSRLSSKLHVPPKYRNYGTVTYMAPELFQNAEHNIKTDLWSLGCVMYQMYTGHPPFLADNFQQLMEKILHKELPPPKVKGTRVSGKTTKEFQSLLDGLLEKDPQKRLGWEGLVTHSFWQGALLHLTKDLDTATQEELRQSVRQSIANFSARASVTSEMPKSNSVLGQIHGVNLRDEPDGFNTLEAPSTQEINTLTDTDRPESTMSLRPRTAPGTGDSVAFTISSRPHTAVTSDTDEHLTATSPQKLLTQSPMNVKEMIRSARDAYAERTDLSQLIYHTSDFTVSAIIDNPKIQKPAALKFDTKTLQVSPYSAEKILSLTPKEQERHLNAVSDCLNTPEKGPPSQKRVQLVNYVASIGTQSQIANYLVNKGVLGSVARQIKDSPTIDIKQKLCRVIGILANNTQELHPTTSLSEPAVILTELLRDSFRNSKVKATLLPALGEIFNLAATQEEIKGCNIDTWAMPAMMSTLVTRCLREGEDPIVNHYAAKIIENVATTTGQHAMKLSVNEVGQLLWTVFTHATADSVRVTAISALSRLSKHNVTVFQSVIEKVGLPKMMSTMVIPVTRIQQAVITMFASLIVSEARLTRLLQDKEFTQSILRLLESPSVVIRGKAFLVILEIIKSNQEMLLVCCQNRLVMYVERDSRRQALGKVEHPGQLEYLSKCLDLLITTLVDSVPNINRDILTSLDAVSGRKHPSTTQIKQLKAALPLMPVINHLVSSQVFRNQLINERFMKAVGQLLHHVKSIETGSTHIQGATGQSGAEEFIHTVFAVVESVAQHPNILTEYNSLVIEILLPQLAILVASSGDTRALSMRLFSEMASLYLTKQEVEGTVNKHQLRRLHSTITESLLPLYEQLLLEQDPLPSYSLKLLCALMEQSPAFIKDFEKLGLGPVLFQVLIDHQNNPVCSTMQHVASILNCLVTHRETNLRLIFEQGLVDHLTHLFIEVAAICMNSQDNSDLKSAICMLSTLLDTLHCALKYVSDVVRRALQAKKGGGEGGNKEAEMAETLLLTNKPFTDLMSLLTQLLVYDDSDIAEMSLKCLSLLVQLFGGENPDALSIDNMNCYSEALKQADAKKQKVILRIIKRMINTERSHCEFMHQHGQQLANTIQTLVHTASSHAEVALTTLAAEVLRVTGYLK